MRVPASARTTATSVGGARSGMHSPPTIRGFAAMAAPNGFTDRILPVARVAQPHDLPLSSGLHRVVGGDGSENARLRPVRWARVDHRRRRRRRLRFGHARRVQQCGASGAPRAEGRAPAGAASRHGGSRRTRRAWRKRGVAANAAAEAIDAATAATAIGEAGAHGQTRLKRPAETSCGRLAWAVLRSWQPSASPDWLRSRSVPARPARGAKAYSCRHVVLVRPLSPVRHARSSATDEATRFARRSAKFSAHERRSRGRPSAVLDVVPQRGAPPRAGGRARHVDVAVGRSCRLDPIAPTSRRPRSFRLVVVVDTRGDVSSSSHRRRLWYLAYPTCVKRRFAPRSSTRAELNREGRCDRTAGSPDLVLWRPRSVDLRGVRNFLSVLRRGRRGAVVDSSVGRARFMVYNMLWQYLTDELGARRRAPLRDVRRGTSRTAAARRIFLRRRVLARRRHHAGARRRRRRLAPSSSAAARMPIAWAGHLHGARLRDDLAHRLIGRARAPRSCSSTATTVTHRRARQPPDAVEVRT